MLPQMKAVDVRIEYDDNIFKEKLYTIPSGFNEFNGWL